VAHPGGAPDDLSDAAKGPQLGIKAVGLGAPEQCPFDEVELGDRQLGGAAGWPEAAQSLGAVVAPAALPTADGLPGDAEPTGDLGLVDALLKQVGCVQATFLEHLAVPALGGEFAITGCDGMHAASPTPSCHPKPQTS
jgi:hypothetical protein